jgi:hypothetical protein
VNIIAEGFLAGAVYLVVAIIIGKVIKRHNRRPGEVRWRDVW